GAAPARQEAKEPDARRYPREPSRPFTEAEDLDAFIDLAVRGRVIRRVHSSNSDRVPAPDEPPGEKLDEGPDPAVRTGRVLGTLEEDLHAGRAPIAPSLARRRNRTSHLEGTGGSL